MLSAVELIQMPQITTVSTYLYRLQSKKHKVLLILWRCCTQYNAGVEMDSCNTIYLSVMNESPHPGNVMAADAEHGVMHIQSPLKSHKNINSTAVK